MDIFEKYVRAINSIQAPGLPDNKVAVFVGDEVFTDAEEPSVEKYVNEYIIPWAFMNGIYCKGMTHGNFVVNRDYQKPEGVVKNKEEDFYLNTDILNYVYAVMAAATDIRKAEKGTVIVVGYCGEADIAYVNRYSSEEEFTKQAEQEIKDLDYSEEDDEEEDVADEDYESQFGSEMAIRICRANNIPLSDIGAYGSDAYWINDGINNLQDLYEINEEFVIPTGDEDLIRDYREEILEEDE